MHVSTVNMAGLDLRNGAEIEVLQPLASLELVLMGKEESRILKNERAPIAHGVATEIENTNKFK